jgi:hypothetical protein
MKRNRRKTGFAVAVVLIAVLAITGIAFAGGADKDSEPVVWWWDAAAPVGSSTIVRNDNGISSTYSASLSNSVASADGLAVTLWVVVFNDPGACATDPCTDSDLFDPDVMPDVLYGAGNVVDDSEIASFGFHRKAGDNSGSIATLFGMPTDNNGQPFGLKYPRSAEIHYVLRTHGPKDPMYMPSQIHTYGGGCVDFAPFGYFPPTGPNDLYLGVGQCQDVQFAINQ